jgi:hypothetical protein
VEEVGWEGDGQERRPGSCKGRGVRHGTLDVFIGSQGVPACKRQQRLFV